MKNIEIGFKSGYLTVSMLVEKIKGKHRTVIMRCVCGAEKEMRLDWITSQRVKSCGCKKSELVGKHLRTHGMSGTSEYETWCSMKRRCLNPKDREYKNYGGRGIKVCDRWLNSFENFYADLGARPDGFEIDRTDVNGNYEPSNCKWVSYLDQMHNMRTTKLSMEKAREIRRLRLEGKTYKELSAAFKVSEGSIGFVLSNQQWKEVA